MKRRVFITEKFALLNLLKALEGLSGRNAGAADGKTAEGATDKAQPPSTRDAPPNTSAAQTPTGAQTQSAAPPQRSQNVMVGVLERHERISNRIRSKGQKLN